MKYQHHFDTSAASEREAAKIFNTIKQFYREVRLLDVDILAEEFAHRTSNRSDPTYSMLARTLVARRDNLLKTIDALNRQLPKQDHLERVAQVA